MTTAVRVAGLSKRFGAVHALKEARLEAFAGEVHGLLGENGAGKTTLLSVLAGLLRPDEGDVAVAGQAVDIRSPRDARGLGIGMVHQHFKLVPRLTVVENLLLGWPGAALSLPEDEVRGKAEALASETGLTVKLDAPVETLGVGERQRVEILKVLLQEPAVLILDEPTAVLSPPEVKGLLALIRTLAERGTAVLLVAHKLDEVLSVAHRVTVLRKGETVLEAPRSEVDARSLAQAMVGQATADGLTHLHEAATVGEGANSEEGEPDVGGAMQGSGPAVVSLVRAGFVDDQGVERVRDVSLTVHPGEIVGVAGVEGNGQRELAQLLSGVVKPTTGSVDLPDDPSFIPQDRRTQGLVQDFTLTENVALRLRRWPEFGRRWFMNWAGLEERTRTGMETFSVRAEGPATRVSTLSGGNQQRVVLARELAGDPDFVVAENPTRGLDVAGEAFVHEALRGLRHREGGAAGVVLVSTDLDEVLALADRFFVMVRGRLEPVERGPNLRERLGQRMLGAE